jgi:Cu2+-exporting ATPase
VAEALAVEAGAAPSGAAASARTARTTETVTLAVDHMHCGACMRTVEDALLDIPGVRSARVHLADRRVTAEIDARAVSTEALVEALDKVGFSSAEISLENAGPMRSRDADLTRRLGVAGFAAMNIMLLSVSVWSGSGGDMEPSVQALFHWLSALIALPAVAYAGQPFFRSAAQALKARRLNMDVPISLGVILATAMSLYQTVRHSDQVYFDAAITLLAFLLVGRLLDQQMRTRASSAAANLLGLKASAATVVDAAGVSRRVPLRAIEPGMTVLAAAGERIAVDGIVASGESEIDQALITGESAPRRVAAGAAVYAGTVNLSQPIAITATRHDENTLLADIARLMAAAEQGRGRYVRLADRAARIYAPAVHILGLVTFVGWMLAGHGWEAALTAAIAVLIITCPCALALAVPAVQVAAASRLFSKGIILKAADGLERLAEIDHIVLDKTGTLTVGEPRLVNEADIGDGVLAAAAGLAAASRHPYSRAIVRAATDRGLAVPAATGVAETAGSGLARVTPAGEVRLGSARWCGVSVAEGAEGVIWFKPADGAATAFRFADALRDDSAAIVAKLKAAGFGVEILSGDAAGPVAAAAHSVGVSVAHAEQRPDQKIARLEALKASGRTVLMVGDGLNDAPALAAAHASISPAAASDISQTVADGIFQGSRFAPVAELIAVARMSRRLALQNFGLAIAYNAVFVPLAMAGYVTPLIAAIAMSASSITVTANAIRLKAQELELTS